MESDRGGNSQRRCPRFRNKRDRQLHFVAVLPESDG